MAEHTFTFIEPELQAPSSEEVQPASYLRREFMVPQDLRHATLRITGLGVYRAYLNGEAVDDQYLLPGFTDYRHRVQYQEYDVTDRLRAGANALGVVIADGWYRGCLGLSSRRCYYGDKLKLAVELVLEGADGEQVVRSGKDWRATQEGPLIKSDVKVIEAYDARRGLAGWAEPGFDDGSWHGVAIGSYDGSVVPHEGAPIREQERFVPEVLHTPDGRTVLDFGQNHAGHVAFEVAGPAGTTVVLTMGECLDAQGNFTLANLRADPKPGKPDPVGQRLEYTLCEGRQSYRSQFLVSGYRYALVENWPEEVRAENFSSLAIHSAVLETGSFECSNEKVNQLVRNVRWSQRSNFVDVPTDCPQRERAGWTGDINVFSEAACYLTDPRAFLRKWLRDFACMQQEDGALPYIVPEMPFDVMPIPHIQEMPWSSAGWSDALVNVPMTLYRFFGEKEQLEEVYEAAKKSVDYNERRAEERNPLHALKREKHYRYILDTGYHWGEWLEPGGSLPLDGMRGIFAPDAEVATAWFFHSASQVAQMARILGHDADAEHYEGLASRIRDAYRREFLRDGRVQSKRMCRYVRPVSMGLASSDEAKVIVADLARLAGGNSYRIGTGFLTTWQILNVLADHGQLDAAYRMLENEDCPGWLYEVNQGATTIWENWLGVGEDGEPHDSHNHYASGSVVAWLFSHCAGIRPEEAGFGRVLVQPQPGGSLTWARASYQSVRGKVVSAWERNGETFHLHVELPDGVPATIVLPDGRTHEVRGGMHDLSCELPARESESAGSKEIGESMSEATTRPSMGARVSAVGMRALAVVSTALTGESMMHKVMTSQKPPYKYGSWKVPKGYRTSEVELPHARAYLLEREGGTSDKIIYQVHGGGYVAPFSNLYFDTAVHMSQLWHDAPVFNVDYRTAPDNVFPCALEDALDGWRWLLDQGYDPACIVLTGDSAGGGLALALCLWLRDHGEALPCGLVLSSPWTDMTASGESYTTKRSEDPLFGHPNPSKVDRYPVPIVYAAGHDLRDPYLSPRFGSYEDMPPMIVQTGEAELLLSDSDTVVEHAREAGVDVTYQTYPGMCHTFYVVSPKMPESRIAWERIGTWLQGRG